MECIEGAQFVVGQLELDYILNDLNQNQDTHSHTNCPINCNSGELGSHFYTYNHPHMANKRNQTAHKKADKQQSHKKKNKTPSPEPPTPPKPWPKPQPIHKKACNPHPNNSPDTSKVPNDILAAMQGPLGLAGQDTTSQRSLSNPADSDIINCSSLEVVNGMDVEDNVTSSSEDEDSNPSSDAKEEGV